MRYVYLAGVITAGLIVLSAVAFGLIAFVQWEWPNFPVRDPWGTLRALVGVWLLFYVACIPAANSTWPSKKRSQGGT